MTEVLLFSLHNHTFILQSIKRHLIEQFNLLYEENSKQRRPLEHCFQSFCKQ